MCGEQRRAPTMPRPPSGSPPRVRGTVVLHCAHQILQRITPACAGNRVIFKALAVTDQDHPRVCGEQSPPSLTILAMSGSPPRVRGTGRRRSRAGGRCRITPACAGNSAPGPPKRIRPPDHPRVCGEQSNIPCSMPWVWGSPPRVRGTDCAQQTRNTQNRITPACAGNSA